MKLKIDITKLMNKFNLPHARINAAHMRKFDLGDVTHAALHPIGLGAGLKVLGSVPYI